MSANCSNVTKVMRHFNIVIGSVRLMCLITSYSSALSCPEIFWKSMRQVFYNKLFPNFLIITGIADSETLIFQMTSVPPIFRDAIRRVDLSNYGSTFYNKSQGVIFSF